ncbi:MAG TPA: biopolymer transporter ExbD [Chitinophagaceae bacterium]|nr:biopolymer transporter ExbD [Chitinophagaceae bacterium]
MAEIISNKNRKSNPRIDFTPMVDLGFLLITFFIMTSRLSEPMSIDLQMPKEGGTQTKIPHHTAMTIYLGAAHQLYYYTALDAMNSDFSKLKTSNFLSSGIRTALLEHSSNVKAAFKNGLKGSTDHDLPFILIKASKNSQYADLVNLLDELAISNIRDYAIVDLELSEEAELEKRASISL